MTLKIVDHDKAWNVCISFLFFFFSLNWGKNTYFFWENIWIHIWFYTFLWDDWELIDLQTSCSNSFSYLKRSTNKTEIKWNKKQYKNTKLYLGHKKKKKKKKSVLLKFYKDQYEKQTKST